LAANSQLHLVLYKISNIKYLALFIVSIKKMATFVYVKDTLSLKSTNFLLKFYLLM